MSREQHDRGANLGGVTYGHAGAFWIGVALVTMGVVLHLPMYLMGASNGYRLAGMPMNTSMKFGMAAIIVGLLSSLFGLFPRSAGEIVRRASRFASAPWTTSPSRRHTSACSSR
jgi:hypothetical protein